VPVVLSIELELETDGRWIAEVIELPGVLAYGTTGDEAIAHVQALALRVVADRLERDEASSDLLNITFAYGMTDWPSAEDDSSDLRESSMDFSGPSLTGAAQSRLDNLG